MFLYPVQIKSHMSSASFCHSIGKSMFSPSTWMCWVQHDSQAWATQVAVTYEYMHSGSSKVFLFSPDSSLKVLHDACKRLPVISIRWLPNFISVWICFIVCSMNKFGILRPPHSCQGLWTMALGNVWVKPAEGKPAVSIGLMIILHSVLMSVAMSGYLSFLSTTW